MTTSPESPRKPSTLAIGVVTIGGLAVAGGLGFGFYELGKQSDKAHAQANTIISDMDRAIIQDGFPANQSKGYLDNAGQCSRFICYPYSSEALKSLSIGLDIGQCVIKVETENTVLDDRITDIQSYTLQLNDNSYTFADAAELPTVLGDEPCATVLAAEKQHARWQRNHDDDF